jgi:hypothetical protein
MEERVVRRVFDDHECGSTEGKLSVVKIENVPKKNRTLIISWKFFLVIGGVYATRMESGGEAGPPRLRYIAPRPQASLSTPAECCWLVDGLEGSDSNVASGRGCGERINKFSFG